MISINLAPTEELENRYWYSFDILAFVSICALLFGGSRIYVWIIENQISTVETEKLQLETRIHGLKTASDRFDEIHRVIEREDKNLRSIRSITTSKIAKYEPVILLEYLQTLKPDGVWLDSVQENHAKKMLLITGGAFDNVLIADFMTLLSDTQHVEPSIENVRSLIHFSDVILEKISTDGNSKTETKGGNPSARFDSPAAMVLDRPFSASTSNAKITQQIFPEVKGRPVFSMLLRYEKSELDSKGGQ